jgi:ketosteroid isomerase-like protein
MAQDTAKKFVEALEKLESDRDLETICALFSEDCDIANVVTEDNERPLGVRAFWENYRENFGEVRSTFRNQIIADARAALEWTTTGTSSEGHDFEYDGVSILEIENERITRFRAFFDPNKLGRQIVVEKEQRA